MGFFDKLFGELDQLFAGHHPADRDRRPAWMRTGATFRLYEGELDLDVTGEEHHQDNLWWLAGGQAAAGEIRAPVQAVLVVEPVDAHDRDAISLWVNGLEVGHLSHRDAQRYRPGLLALQQRHGQPIAVGGVIVRDESSQDGSRLRLVLRHDPADFGLAPVSPIDWPVPPSMPLEPPAPSPADAGADRRWIDDLPDDGARAAGVLRQRLTGASDPVERHVLYVQLETLLYRCRNTSASALEEFDEVCRQHDAEMDQISKTFVARWGRLPALEVYRLMAVRQQQAQDLQRALWWVERGIAVYGDDCADPAAVEDLRKRVATYTPRLEATRRPRPTPAQRHDSGSAADRADSLARSRATTGPDLTSGTWFRRPRDSS